MNNINRRNLFPKLIGKRMKVIEKYVHIFFNYVKYIFMNNKHTSKIHYAYFVVYFIALFSEIVLTLSCYISKLTIILY